MRAKYIGSSTHYVTNGKTYDVEVRNGYYQITEDDGDQSSYPAYLFEVIPDEPSTEPAATTNVVHRPKFKPGDKVRLREYAYGTTVRISPHYGSTEKIREVFRVQDNGDGTTQAVIVENVNGITSSLWFDLVESWDPAKAPAPHGAEPAIRTFGTGATRNLDNNKLDHEGFLSPLVIEAFGNYMQSHRLQKDGTMRASDNWQKGIPFDAYMKSGWRHFFDWWKLHRGFDATSPEDGHEIDKVEALCALMFNVQGYMHELLKEQGDGD